MGLSPKIPETKLPPPAPSVFDENILLARKRAKKKALAAFGVRSSTLTTPGSIPASPPLPTIAGSVTGGKNSG
jgi:hypothetical protein